MKKQLATILAFLFSIFMTDQAGNNLLAGTRFETASPVTERNTFIPSASTVYSPADVGMNAVALGRIDSIVRDGLKARAFPGCQVLVMKEGKPVYNKCFGYYTYEQAQKVKPTTLYDLASLSKTTGTLLGIMKLYDAGKLKLNDKAARYLTFLQGTNKENITIKELLFHESGLPAGLPFYRLVIEKSLASMKNTTPSVRKNGNRVVGKTFLYKEDWASKIPTADYTSQVSDSFYLTNRFHQAAMQMIANAPLKSKTYLYSCINFILLKEIVETISGMSMDAFLDKEYYTPMKLANMVYLPLRTHRKEDVAPTLKTDYLRNGVIQGYVHDPDAAFLGGVSGNAGLFATARDVAAVYQMILNQGELDGKRYLSKETCRLFTTTTSNSGRRGLGYDKPVPANPMHSPCCISAPKSVYGHTGYTGTCCWVDPVNDLVYVFLSNRTYPNDGGNKLARMGIRTKIQEVIYQSLKKN
ncbi:MAG: serine hydrolase domain-containing protein [Bacteroidota bacterium]|nr:serine hydrolase domain-containing protein [Bacteroidota bacterium]